MISTTACGVSYVGNGTATVCAVPFPVMEAGHLRVVETDAAGTAWTLQPGFAYTVAIHSDSQGFAESATVTLAAPLASGHRLAIDRVLPLVQKTLLSNVGGYYPQVIEKELDRGAMIDQQLQAQLDRAVVAPAGAEPGDMWGALEQGFRDIEELKSDKADRAELSFKTDQSAFDAHALENLAQTAAIATDLARLDAEKASESLVANQTAALESAVAIVTETVTRQIERLEAKIPAAMPAAPDDGRRYFASGNRWYPLAIEAGPPFAVNAKGYVTLQQRLVYTRTPLWNVGEYATIARTARPGDTDGVFVVGASGYLHLRRA